jgi:hypothetical protein
MLTKKQKTLLDEYLPPGWLTRAEKRFAGKASASTISRIRNNQVKRSAAATDVLEYLLRSALNNKKRIERTRALTN